MGRILLVTMSLTQKQSDCMAVTVWREAHLGVNGGLTNLFTVSSVHITYAPNSLFMNPNNDG